MIYYYKQVIIVIVIFLQRYDKLRRLECTNQAVAAVVMQRQAVSTKATFLNAFVLLYQNQLPTVFMQATELTSRDSISPTCAEVIIIDKNSRDKFTSNTSKTCIDTHVGVFQRVGADIYVGASQGCVLACKFAIRAAKEGRKVKFS